MKTPTKRILSFSLFGANPKYHVGVLRNAELAPAFYPGWEFRVYVAPDVPHHIVKILEQKGAMVHVKNVKVTAAEGLFWRFAPVGEPDVDAVCVRDADSRLSLREKEAVDVWLESGKILHIMRDHPSENSPIMAGMCGFRGSCTFDYNYLLRLGLREYAPVFGLSSDQVWLAQQIYPRLRRDALIHSELVKFMGEHVEAFPETRVNGDFVGRIFDENDVPSPQLSEKDLGLREYVYANNSWLVRIVRNTRFMAQTLLRARTS